MPQTYSDEDIIKLRKIRDSLGVMLTSPSLSSGDRDLLLASIRAIMHLPGITEASSSKGRGVVELEPTLDPEASYGWRMYV